MSNTALEILFKRDRRILIASIAVLTTLAWVYLIWLARGMSMAPPAMPNMSGMPGMDMEDMGSMLARGGRGRKAQSAPACGQSGAECTG